MQYYEENNQIEIKDEYDIVVVGGGIAGVSAALAATRKGMRTLIIEKMVCAGGLATLGHVVWYEPLDDGYGNQVIGGISEELLKLSIKYGYDNMPRYWKDRLGIKDNKADDPETWPIVNVDQRCATMFNIPAFVYAIDELLEQEGVEIIYDTVFCKPIMEGNCVTGVIVENKSGRYAYGCRMVVDASGDADVMYLAGAATSDYKNRLTYICYELDFKRMQDAIDHNNMYRAFPVWLVTGYRPGVDAGTGGFYYATDAEEKNKFIKESRKLALKQLKENLRPDYTHVSIDAVPAFRTTRRIDSQYLVTEKDYFRHFEDSIGVTGDWRCIGPVLEIPYRSLIDRKVENVIAAGRNIGAGGDAWELTRCIPEVALTGEAAGYAAAQAIKNGQALQQIDVTALQDTILKNGGIIHMKEEVMKYKDTIQLQDYVKNQK